MNITQCSFEQMMTQAAGNPELAKATSFMQVEYGIDDLRASWDGFVDTSKYYKVEFKTRKHLCERFAETLADYIDYLQPGTNEVGSAFP
jgi:hypothetical protein